MWPSLIVFGVAYLAIATEKVDKTAAALLGATVAVVLQLVPYEAALHAVDLNVILLLVGMMLSVNVMADTGLFEWLAVSIARFAKGEGLRILLLFLVVTAVLSAFLDNVTTVILVAPITILVCSILELPVVPFLVFEALSSNIGGAATLVGDPPNVIIASATGLSFNEFIINLGPPVLIMVAVGLLGATLMLRGELNVTEANKARIMATRPELAILDPSGLKRSLAVFALILFGFFAGHAYGVEPGIVAIGGSLLMAVVCGVDLHHALEKVEWTSVFFFVGLFMLIGALEHNHVFEALGNQMIAWTGGDFMTTIFMVLWFAAFGSAIVDNIPLVIAMIPLLETIIPVFAASMGVADDPAVVRAQVAEPLYWSLALGACLGGNGTLVGASANVVVAQIAKRNNAPLSFATFSKYGIPTMIVSVAIANAWLYAVYFME